MMKLYGNPYSRANRVRWALEASGTKFEEETLSLDPDGTGSQRYRAINPNGLVPAIDDDGLILFESIPICLYIAKKYAPDTLYVDSLPIRLAHQAKIGATFHTESGIGWPIDVPEDDRASEFLEKTARKWGIWFGGCANRIGKVDSIKDEALVLQWSVWAMTELEKHNEEASLHVTWYSESQRDDKIATAEQAEVSRCLSMLENAIKDSGFLVANRFTIADLIVSEILTALVHAKINLNDFPHVKRYLKSNLSQPSAQKAFEPDIIQPYLT